MSPLELIKKVGIFELFTPADGCPCFQCEIKGVKIWTHCWRPSCNVCKYSGIHIAQHWDCDWDLKEIGEEVKRQVEEIWGSTTEFELVYDKYE